MFKNQISVSVDKNKIKELLTRGVEDVFVLENLERKLSSGKQLRVKLGFDPTGSKIHIGRAVVLRKLKAFQDLGHKIVFIVGDFTAQIGDPSDKLEKRPTLSKKEIENNLKNYKKQIGEIINLKKAEFHFNSKWLGKVGFGEICQLAESFSVQQMSARRNFKDRFDKGEEVSLREFLYPLMQGYDSVVVKADIEIGGFDQLFNLKAGRIIQKHYRMAEQDVLVTQMLLGTDGRKMSTSWGNVINTTDEPSDMFGKVMSLKDELIATYFTLCTNVSLEEVENIKKRLEKGENPRDIKIELARAIVSVYYGEKAGERAGRDFVNVFKKGGIPENTEEIKVGVGTFLVDILLAQKIVSSKTDFRRLISEGAVSVVETNEKIITPNFKIEKTVTFRVGKKRFVKLMV